MGKSRGSAPGRMRARTPLAAIAATETRPDIHPIDQKELKELSNKIAAAAAASHPFEKDSVTTAEMSPVSVNTGVSLTEEFNGAAKEAIAGLSFTDLETETTEKNTGGTNDIWLSPEASDDSQPAPTRHGNEPLLEPPLELRSPHAVAQTITVEELSDIDPNHWSYRAVQSLVEDYDCLEGFPDDTFRGNQSVTRYEFAAGLNACLSQVTGFSNLSSVDQETIAALAQQFDTELIELTTDVERLAAVIEELQANQFSPTTRLFGQVIFGLQGRTNNTADFFPVDGNAETDDPGAGVVDFYSNAQLSLISRLTRRDLLLISLQAGQGNSLFDANTNSALGLTNNIRLAYEGDTDFDVELTDLTYRRLIGDSVALIVGAAGVNPVSVFRGPSEAEGAGSGPLSIFAQRNPILSIGSGDTGLGFDWQIIDRLSLQGVYTVADGNNPSDNTGLFEGDRTLGFQLTASPLDNVNFALNYINSYSEGGNLGTGIGDSQLTAGDAMTTNAFGATLAWDVTPRFTIGGWGGRTTSVTPGETGSVETVNWMAFMNFPDLFGPGNLGGLYVGQPPRITDSDLRQGQNIPDLLAGNLGEPGCQPGSTLHIEAFYRYQLTDNISLTPGVIILQEPANASGSDTITIGALRTTFRF